MRSEPPLPLAFPPEGGPATQRRVRFLPQHLLPAETKRGGEPSVVGVTLQTERSHGKHSLPTLDHRAEVEGAEWLPPGDDGRVSPARAHLKCQGAASSLLSCRAREGLGPEHEDWGAARARRPGAGSPVAREPASSEQGGPDQSPDGDSSSDYVNNTSEEKDYDSGLPEEEEGITYFIRYCPEDDSSLQGRDCEGRGYLAHDAHHLEMDERQEAVQEWTEPGPSDSPQGLPTH
ncbi:hypothetical protein MJT46_019077 [Ovis ammon polii x Ovis aries]|nr:hypothetical protein MJT46_019077 [Ovis ammon polii x Ovis aries]